MSTRLNDEDFIAAWKRLGGAQAVADEFGYAVRAVYTRRNTVERRHGIKLIAECREGGKARILIPENGNRATMDMENGTILVGSDCHYWPGEPVSDAHRAFVACAKKLKPTMVVLNGDIFDFASISRHPKLNTRSLPSLKQEVEEVQTRTSEIEAATPNSIFYRTLGNHDLRLEVRIANQSPEFEGMLTLKDFLPRWVHSLSLMLNGTVQFVHKYHNGMHAAHNNVRKAGGIVSVITGHTHRLGCRPFSHYSGHAYGIETGTLANPESQAFDYCLDTPKDWQPGFAVLTIRDGQLMYPEFAHVVDGKCTFRGEDLI